MAALLCLTAGFVNVTGFMAFTVLTTNVTGHVAAFAARLAQGDFAVAWVTGLWMFMFLLGAFISSFIVNNIFYNRQFSYLIPIITEVAILIAVALYGQVLAATPNGVEVCAAALLFAMGMQNALVSVISGSVVRTTHLTGMFTDLGIELAALFKGVGNTNVALLEQVKLRLIIIVFFFLGGIFGGCLFHYLHYYTFLIPSAILLVALFFDVFRLRAIQLARKLNHLGE